MVVLVVHVLTVVEPSDVAERFKDLLLKLTGLVDVLQRGRQLWCLYC